MIPWWVGLLLYFLGSGMGIVMMAIVFFSNAEAEGKRNRQRGNADGSPKYGRKG